MWPEVTALLERYESEPEHVRQVAMLADQIFLGWQPWHGRGERERAWLQVAAWLHDIGWSQTPDGRGHHKWSARLIVDFDWGSFPREEVALIAQIARYHRRSLPVPHHEAYQVLSVAQQCVVGELAGILRVADGLDRTHRQVIQTVTGLVAPPTLRLQVRARETCAPELAMAQKKGDLIERISGSVLVLEEAGP